MDFAVNGTIRECVNTAPVVGYEYVSGIIGQVTGAVPIEFCYNSGNIKSNNQHIAGMVCSVYNVTGCVLRSCYNIGSVTIADESFGYGLVYDYYADCAQVDNCYYLKGTAKEDSKGISKTEEEMKQTDFVNTLNNGDDQIWKPDVDNKNNGFPILNWQ